MMNALDEDMKTFSIDSSNIKIDVERKVEEAPAVPVRPSFVSSHHNIPPTMSQVAPMEIDVTVRKHRRFSMKDRFNNKKGKRELLDRGKSCGGRLPMWLPTQTWRRAWDIFLFVALFWSCLYIPYEVGFDIQFSIGSLMYVLNIIIDLYFCVDCALNFNVGIVKRDGEITTDPVKVRRAYLRGWFAIDLVTSVPFGAIVDIFTNGGSSSRFGDLPKTLRVVRILRLFKLFRMFKLLSLMKRWQGDDSVMFVFLKALTLALVMILTTHLLACVWAFTAVSEANDGLFNTDSWPVRYLDYTHVSEMQSFHAYLHALYWSVITVTTVGYGDRVPVTDGELMITIFSACSGVCVFGYLMGSVSSVITHENSASLQLKARINELIYWMDVHNLPKELKKRIRRHYTHVWKNCGVTNNDIIFTELPTFLRRDVAACLHIEVIQDIPFFKHMGDVSPGALAQLVVQLNLTRAVKSQVIIHKGEFGDEMFVVANGLLSRYDGKISSDLLEQIDGYFYNMEEDSDDHFPWLQDVPSSQVGMYMYEEGSHFAQYNIERREGENHVEHPFSVIAVEMCDLFVLLRSDYINILKQYPTEFHDMVKGSIKKSSSSGSGDVLGLS